MARLRIPVLEHSRCCFGRISTSQAQQRLLEARRDGVARKALSRLDALLPRGPAPGGPTRGECKARIACKREPRRRVGGEQRDRRERVLIPLHWALPRDDANGYW